MLKIYTKKTCGYCHLAKKLLQSKAIIFDEIDVGLDVEQFNTMVNKTGGCRTVPQIFIKDELIGGFMELASLAQSGKLEQLLAEGNV